MKKQTPLNSNFIQENSLLICSEMVPQMDQYIASHSGSGENL